MDNKDGIMTQEGATPRLRGRATARRTAEGEALLGNSTIFAAKSNRFESTLLTIQVDGQERLARRDYQGNIQLVDIEGKRLLMFERQNAARMIMGKESRLRFCLRWSADKIKDGRSPVSIQKNGMNARYKNLSVCGLGWLCPVCANKISEHRRQEMVKAQDRHDEAGGKRFLITWTFPHKNTDELSVIYSKLAKARQLMTAHRTYKNYYKNCVGSIRTVEITFGANGWHPHVHEIWFANASFDVSDLKTKLFDIWSTCCEKVGLPKPSFEHGVDIKSNQFASDYIAKWGFEMTRWHQKQGHSNGMTPFQFLDAYIDETDDKKASFYRAKFQEFAVATKGTNQLRWSRGLKAHFGIDEVEDESIANDKVDESTQYQFFMFLDRVEWKFIRDFRKGNKRVKSDLRANVLQIAATSDSPNQVYDYLESQGLTKEKRDDIIKHIQTVWIEKEK